MIDGEQHLVQDTAIGVGEVSQVDGVRIHVGQRFALPTALHDVKRLGPAHANHSDAATALRGRYGTDGIAAYSG